MLSVTRDKETGQILVTHSGVLDETSVGALLGAVALAPDAAPLVIDLSDAQIPSARSLKQLLNGLVKRGGMVLFRNAPFVEALA